MKINLETTYYLKTLLLFMVLWGFGGVFVVFNPRIYDIIILGLTFVVLAITRGYLSKTMLVVGVGVAALCIIHKFLTQAPVTGYIGIILKVSVVILIIAAFRNDRVDIKTHLVRALYLIMWLSVINLLLITLIPHCFIRIELENGYFTNTLGYIFNYTYPYYINNIPILRNQSLFWEPGVFQSMLIFLVYYEIVERHQPLTKIVVPGLLILSTFSTTGIVLLGLLFLYYFVKNFSINRRFDRSAVMLVLIILFTGFAINELNMKLHGYAFISAYDRKYDFLMGLKVISSHPWLGIGYAPERYMEIIKNMSVVVNDVVEAKPRGNTNSFVTMLYYFGIPTACFLIWRLFKQKLFSNRWLFFIIFSIILFTEPLLMSHFVILILLSSTLANNEGIACY